MSLQVSRQGWGIHDWHVPETLALWLGHSTDAPLPLLGAWYPLVGQTPGQYRAATLHGPELDINPGIKPQTLCPRETRIKGISPCLGVHPALRGSAP